MIYWIALLIGGLLPTFIVSAIAIWAFKKSMGDTPARLFAGFAIAFILIFIISGFGNANGGPFNPWQTLPIYGLDLAFWFGVQWFLYKRRTAKAEVTRPRPIQFD